jgi:hypothetical protein
VHAIVEDSLIFIALGASIFWVVVYRTLWAAVVTLALTALASHWLRRRGGAPPDGRSGSRRGGEPDHSGRPR